ncbi:MAG: KAP family NTPase [Clostridiales Family XIII bacterium]|jgi:hypothetical protein|nr:KAP family NTPase [Clostridiales Family XIII bacterium]
MGKWIYSQVTFERDDVFNRKPFVESITKLISEWGEEIFSDSDALAISIDSPWGTGKTSLICMWANYIKESVKYRNYKLVYYNAWQNNYFEDAFRPLVYELQGIDEGPRIEAFRRASIELAQALDINESNLLKLVAAHAPGDGHAYFEGFKKINQACEDFAKSLEKLVPHNGKLLVFVDELDRCRPNFAVSTLELIRHYMQVPGVVFVFAMDIAQLTHLVKTVYGFDTDAWGYLRRFFNVSFKMPLPDTGKYVDSMLYKSINNNDGLKEVHFSQHMAKMYEYFDLNIRDIEKLTTNFIIFYSMNKVGRDPLKPRLLLRLTIYLYFMIIKYRYPEVYNGIMCREGYRIEGDLVEGGYVLARKYCGHGEVKDMLRTLQGCKFWDEETGHDYIAEYLLPEIAPDAKCVGEHIRDALALFAEVGW